MTVEDAGAKRMNAILTYIKERVDPNGVWMSTGTAPRRQISMNIGASRDTVDRYMRCLRALKVVNEVRKKRGEGWHAIYEYTLWLLIPDAQIEKGPNGDYRIKE